MRRAVPSFLVLIAAFTLAGCVQWATYPPVETTTALTSPVRTPVPRITALAIEHVNAAHGGQRQSFAINLPPGVPPRVYELVLERMTSDAYPQQDADEFAYHVAQMRSRGTEGEVDVIYQRADGVNEMVTVYLERGVVHGWEVERDRAWRIRAQLPAPNYPVVRAQLAGAPDSDDETP